MMVNSSGASRLRRARLRVLPGGLRIPVEKAERRVTEAHVVSGLMRSAVSLLAFAIAINLAAALAVFWQLERSAHLAFLLTSMGAVVLTVGTALVARARQHLCHLLPPSRSPGQRTDWDTSCSHAS